MINPYKIMNKERVINKVPAVGSYVPFPYLSYSFLSLTAKPMLEEDRNMRIRREKRR